MCSLKDGRIKEISKKDPLVSAKLFNIGHEIDVAPMDARPHIYIFYTALCWGIFRNIWMGARHYHC